MRGGKKCGYRARFVGGVRRERVCLSQVQIDPPSSVAAATNCLQFSSPRGEAFLTPSEHGKYGFALWFTFAIRPHPSPTATPSPSKGKAMVRDFFHLDLLFEE